MRYIAIIQPLHASQICYRTRNLLIIGVIWPAAMIFACPNLFFNDIDFSNPRFTPCLMNLPRRDMLIFKYIEFSAFYLIPFFVQIVLYFRISRALFSRTAVRPEKQSKHLQKRRGGVKMLIASVVVYFVCFSPVQVLLFYDTFAENEFQSTWTLLVFVNIMAYMSSAANPLLYSVFSQKFRHKFGQILCCQPTNITQKTSSSISMDHQSGRSNTFRINSFKSTVTEL